MDKPRIVIPHPGWYKMLHYSHRQHPVEFTHTKPTDGKIYSLTTQVGRSVSSNSHLAISRQSAQKESSHIPPLRQRNEAEGIVHLERMIVKHNVL